MNEVDVAYKFFMSPVLSSMFYLATCKFLGSFRQEPNALYKQNHYYKCAIKSLGAIYNLIMSIYSGVTFFLLFRARLSDYGTVIDYSAWLMDHLIESKEVERLCWIFLHPNTVEYFDTFFILLKGGNPYKGGTPIFSSGVPSLRGSVVMVPELVCKFVCCDHSNHLKFIRSYCNVFLLCLVCL